MQRSKLGKTVYLKIGVWYDAEQGHIHMTVPDSRWFHTTLNPKPESKRGHPNLFGKLARCLREAGAPAPEAVETGG